MHAIEWVSLFEAAVRLQALWGIPPAIANDIVRNVVHGGTVEVRARHGYSLVPQIVTGRIQLSQESLWVLPQAGFLTPDYEEIEIDLKALVVEGRKLVPRWISIVTPTFKKASANDIRDAIRAEYDEAQSKSEKPPNIREIVEPVRSRLQSEGFDASGKYIQQLARAEEFSPRRRKRGATVKSDRR